MKRILLFTIFGIGLLLVIGLSSCTTEGCTNENAKNYDENASKDDGSCQFENALNISVEIKVGDELVLLDGKYFENAAGNQYQVERLQFYLTNIDAYYVDNKVVRLADYHYFDMMNSALFDMETKNVHKGIVDSISFTFGLQGALNQDYALPNIIENINMQWPSPMGGGYHFMKMEGKFKANDQTEHNYNVHLGRLIDAKGKTNPSFHVVLPVENVVIDNFPYNVLISMDLNAWFKGEENYDMNNFGEGIMGSHKAQALLKSNGKSNVFKINKSWEDILE